MRNPSAFFTLCSIVGPYTPGVGEMTSASSTSSTSSYNTNNRYYWKKEATNLPTSLFNMRRLSTQQEEEEVTSAGKKNSDWQGGGLCSASIETTSLISPSWCPVEGEGMHEFVTAITFIKDWNKMQIKVGEYVNCTNLPHLFSRKPAKTHTSLD